MKKSLSDELLKERAKRISICIRSSGIKQNVIARFCNVTTQSVGGWKRTGRIDQENLFKLAEITRTRYLWLRDGSGDQEITDPEENSRVYSGDHDGLSRIALGPLADFEECGAFIDSLNHFMAQGKPSIDSLSYLTAFFNRLSGLDVRLSSTLEARTDNKPNFEFALIHLSDCLDQIPEETRHPMGELLKTLCISPNMRDQIIRSMLVISDVEKTEENPIKLGRLKKGWSSGHLAEQLGVSRQTISSWESKDSDSWPERDKWARISEVLTIPIYDIAHFSVMKIPSSTADQSGNIG